MDSAPDDSAFTPPKSFAVGVGLAWDSPLIPVNLVVELPFWMMVPTSIVNITYDGVDFKLLIAEGDSEVFAWAVTDNRRSCGYQGNRPETFETRDDIQIPGMTLMRRKQRSTVYFQTRVHRDIEAAAVKDGLSRQAMHYFASLCEAHLPVLNELIARYRLLTYDYFSYEVSAWDVPVWHVRGGVLGHLAVPLFDYLSIEGRPILIPSTASAGVATTDAEEVRRLELTTGDQIENATGASASPGEFDLLDARNLMERGDYSGAIRRTTTAIEVLVEHVLRLELLKSFDAATTEAKLEASKNDFPGRLRQWQKLSGITLSDSTQASLAETRSIRHEIVHSGRRLSHEERGLAQRLTDMGRWTYNKIENDSVKRDLREKNNVVRAILRPTLAFRFPVGLTPEGFQVRSLRSELEGQSNHPDDVRSSDEFHK
jgi:hypothetical protein